MRSLNQLIDLLVFPASLRYIPSEYFRVFVGRLGDGIKDLSMPWNSDPEYFDERQDPQVEGVVAPHNNPGSGPLYSRFLFHYTSSDGLAGILNSKTLRTSSQEKTNDPREYKEKLVNIVFPEDWDLSDPRRSEYETALRRAYQEVHFGCFTYEDWPSYNNGHWARGFARARNWAQYGENHRGACLVFDRKATIQSAKEWEASVGSSGRSFRSGPIRYVNETLVINNFEPAEVKLHDPAVGPTDFAEYVFNVYHQPLYLEKALDWASESEFRLLLRSVDLVQPHLPIIPSLRAIVLGEAYPEAELSVIHARMANAKLDSQVGLFQLMWHQGAPHLRVLPKP